MPRHVISCHAVICHVVESRYKRHHEMADFVDVQGLESKKGLEAPARST